MKPNEIEALSFQIIDKEAGDHRFENPEWQIVRRMIHTSADFEYIHTVRIHPKAIESGISAIRNGAMIITDTDMVKAGIRKKELEMFGSSVSCFIHHPDVIQQADQMGQTRASVAVDYAIPLINGSIYVIGNAPTALFRLIEIVKSKKVKPALIIGFPVGFVQAAESKEALQELDCPYITCTGRKGGSTIAASVVNALITLTGTNEIDKKVQKQTGKLYGIGVGPGDPELLPIKSVRILKSVDVVFAASSSKNEHSLSVNIAQQYIPKSTPIIVLPFPMTTNKDQTMAAWLAHASTIIEHIEQGKTVAFITLGDPLTYSTFGYILRIIQQKAPHIPIETIPGITSYQAAAAKINTPLVEGEESLMIMSGVHGGAYLRNLNGKPENIVMLKAYRKFKDIALALEETGLIHHCAVITNCGLENEEIIRDATEFGNRAPGYLTLIIAKRNYESKNHTTE